jgi:hypothetical protein
LCEIKPWLPLCRRVMPPPAVTIPEPLPVTR